MSFDLLGIFGAGLLTFLTPCVLPLIPVYLSILAGSDVRRLESEGKGQLMLRAGAFAAGFAVVFMLLGLTASAVGSFLAAHKSVLQAVAAVLILVFGLKFLGVIRIPWLDSVLRADDRRWQTRFGLLNAFVFGLVFAAGWSPCVGPVLGSVLTYTASAASNPWMGAVYLLVYALGFALPLLLVAAFAQVALPLLKKIGQHLGKIEKTIGVLLIAVAATLALDLAPVLKTTGDQERIELTTQRQAEPVMIYFTSSRCPVCERMEPVMDALLRRCAKRKVGIVEYDLAQPSLRHLIDEYRVVGTPTFVFLDKEGREVARLIGEQTESALRQALSALMGAPCPGVGPLDGKQTST
jgi:cytochrome c-type biogenesis protein